MTLADEGGAILAALEAWVTASEDRSVFRAEHGRGLSVEHRDRLKQLAERLDALLTETTDDDPLARFRQLRVAAESLR